MSTLEILIALCIFTVSITAVVMLAFGNQSAIVDTEIHSTALSLAQEMLESERALARQDYLSASTTSIVSDVFDGLTYNKTMVVADLTQCKKQAISTVTWNISGQPQAISLTTILSDVAGALALGGDCTIDPPFADWSNPQEKSSLSFGEATDIDVFQNNAYITLVDSSNLNPDISIVNVISSASPDIIVKKDMNGSPGFNAIDVATSTNGHLYAYIAQNDNQRQFVVIDVSDKTNPIMIASSTLPNISYTCTPVSPCKAGQSIYYYKGKVYIGTNNLAFGAQGTNNELHIFDVADPTNPQWKDSIEINRKVNAIVVRSGLAYLATGSGSTGAHNPLKIFDVDPSSPTYKQQIGSFIATGDEDGTSLYLIENKLYLGLQHASSLRPDFYILDVSKPSSVISLASTSLNLSSSSQVNGIRVGGNLGFLGVSDPNKGLQIRDISKITIPLIKSYNFEQNTTGIDLEDNTVYLSSNSDNRTLEIVGPTP